MNREQLREGIAKIICCLAEGKPNGSDVYPALNNSSDCNYCKSHKGCPDSWPDVAEKVDSILNYLGEQGVGVMVDCPKAEKCDCDFELCNHAEDCTLKAKYFQPLKGGQ